MGIFIKHERIENGNQISKLHVSREEAIAMIQQHQQTHVIPEEVQKVFKQ